MRRMRIGPSRRVVALVFVLDVQACKLRLDLVGERLGGVAIDQVGLFDQEVVVGGIAPGRAGAGTSRAAGRGSVAPTSTAATTWNSDSFSPVRLEKWAPLLRNSMTGALPWNPTQRTRS